MIKSSELWTTNRVAERGRLRARLSVLTVCILSLSGCSSLQPVVDFGKNASAIVGYPDVADDYPAILQSPAGVSDELFCCYVTINQGVQNV